MAIIVCLTSFSPSPFYCLSVFSNRLEDDILGADVWIERTLSFDLDIDDDLSWGAPSVCGEISF
jgi:hypothetical protein